MNIKAETDDQWISKADVELPQLYNPQSSTRSLRDCWDYEEPLLTTTKIHNIIIEDMAEAIPQTASDLYTCDTCSAEFQDKLMLKVHIKSVHTCTSLDCEIVNRIVSDSPIVDSLPSSASGPSSNGSLSCGSKCILPYNAESMCSDTKNSHNIITLRYSETPNNSEELCNDSKARKDILSKSCNDSTCIKQWKILRLNGLFNEIVAKIFPLDNRVAIIECYYCGIKTIDRFSKKQFMSNNSGQSQLLHGHSCCDACLKTHLIIAHKVELLVEFYECSFCDYKSCHRFTMKRHLIKHTGFKPYKCDFCDYRCARIPPLKRHMMRHIGHKPYSCTSCDYKAVEKNAMKRHMRLHAENHCYKCTLCSYNTIKQHSLTRHMLEQHTGFKL